MSQSENEKEETKESLSSSTNASHLSSDPSSDASSESSPQPSSDAQDDEDEFKYHPGYLYVDWDGDFWADHDEDCHGRIDTNAMRREYPGGFVWDCCGAHGDEKGCSVRSREATPIAEKYATSPEPSLDEAEYHHPGFLEVDWDGDFWADHDEDCHGPIDTKTNRKDYPEGFVWNCCGKIGTFAEGCVRSN